MSYYRGDYSGGYYKGDPFIGALIGGVAKSVGLGKVAAKAARWVGQRVSGSTLKKATAVAAGAAATLPVLPGLPPRAAGGTMPITLGPIGIDPGAALPGGRPLVTLGVQRRRRMNVLNPKALKRALRRAEGFEKIAKRTVNALHTGPKRFKSTRKRSS